ncbi:hypothetical protein [Sphingomonas sp. KC8]|uniref:hypothetical protein n=1 Tax=Sphingomonas sp. KC8 TaxID=1030157 RepID=UPI000248AB34|nr:hypothetical protein [Sphingomonas sp. KC8]ARS28791.1 hypothetical protein KC8_16045 [Sphingomonas sp. KC8]
MFSKDNPAEYLERAEMHEQLAAATDDVPARKMHLAMAAEYRRKAAELGGIQIVPPSTMGPMLKMNVAAH